MLQGNITYNSYTITGDGYTFLTGGENPTYTASTFIHEVAHLLYSCPHVMGANNVMGNRFFIQTAGWGMMMPWWVTFFTANAWERWLLAWTETVSASGQTADITADAGNEFTFTVRDFVTTGDALRIKLPGIADNYLWVENHQKINRFDYKPWAGSNGYSSDGELLPDVSTGLYCYVENVAASRNNFPQFSMDRWNGIRVLNAQGNFDYTRSSIPLINPNYYYGNVLFTYGRASENPISGLNPLFAWIDDYPKIEKVNGVFICYPGSEDGVISFTENHFNSTRGEFYSMVREANGTNTNMLYGNTMGVNSEATSLFNRRPEAFTVGDEIGLSGIVPALNSPLYSTTTHKQTPYILNGLSLTVNSYNASTKAYTVTVKYNDFEFRRNIRWCGDIILPTGVPLVLKPSVELLLDKSGTPNRRTQTSAGDFVNPTILTFKPGATFTMESQSVLRVSRGSTLTLETGSKLSIGEGALLIIEAGSTLYLENCAEIEALSSGQIVAKEGAILKIAPNTILNLHEGQAALSIAPGVIIPNGFVNPLAVVPPAYHIAKGKNTTWAGGN